MAINPGVKWDAIVSSIVFISREHAFSLIGVHGLKVHRLGVALPGRAGGCLLPERRDRERAVSLLYTAAVTTMSNIIPH